MRGVFITFEGVEGAGKTTQLRRIEERLRQQGYTVVVTREPGGTPISEAIRRLLLDTASAGMAPLTELLLYEAARAQHVAERILPALEKGEIVLCDRFADSTSAYQGAGRNLEPEVVRTLHRIAAGGLSPDITILLDLPVREGLLRASRNGEKDRIESEPLAFHERVREQFRQLAREEPDRIKVVDATQPVAAVSNEIWHYIQGALEQK